MERPPLKDSAVQPVGATISAADLVGLLVGSDRLQLRGFDRHAEQETLPIWVPQAQVTALGSPDAARPAQDRARRFRALALVLAIVLVGAGCAGLGWVAGQMWPAQAQALPVTKAAQEVPTAPVQPGASA